MCSYIDTCIQVGLIPDTSIAPRVYGLCCEQQMLLYFSVLVFERLCIWCVLCFSNLIVSPLHVQNPVEVNRRNGSSVYS